MPSPLMALFAAVGVSEAEVNAAVSGNAVVREAVISKTHEAQQTWIGIWDSSDHPYETGQYRDSINVRFETKPSGYFVGTVESKDFKAHWIEYGAAHMPEFAPATRTTIEMGGSVALDDSTHYKSDSKYSGHSARKLSIGA